MRTTRKRVDSSPPPVRDVHFHLTTGESKLVDFVLADGDIASVVKSFADTRDGAAMRQVNKHAERTWKDKRVSAEEFLSKEQQFDELISISHLVTPHTFTPAWLGIFPHEVSDWNGLYNRRLRCRKWLSRNGELTVKATFEVVRNDTHTGLSKHSYVFPPGSVLGALCALYNPGARSRIHTARLSVLLDELLMVSIAGYTQHSPPAKVMFKYRDTNTPGIQSNIQPVIKLRQGVVDMHNGLLGLQHPILSQLDDNEPPVQDAAHDNNDPPVQDGAHDNNDPPVQDPYEDYSGADYTGEDEDIESP